MNYISLKQASKISDYHPDYLSQLIKKGKNARGKNWQKLGHEQKAIENYISVNNFSLIKNFFFPYLFRFNLKIIPVFVLIISIINMTGFLFLNQ
jgi:hypothetical protein